MEDIDTEEGIVTITCVKLHLLALRFVAFNGTILIFQL